MQSSRLYFLIAIVLGIVMTLFNVFYALYITREIDHLQSEINALRIETRRQP